MDSGSFTLHDALVDVGGQKSRTGRPKVGGLHQCRLLSSRTLWSGAKWLLAAADDEADGGNVQAVDLHIVHQESTEVPRSNKPVKESRYGRATYASRIKARLR